MDFAFYEHFFCSVHRLSINYNWSTNAQIKITSSSFRLGLLPRLFEILFVRVSLFKLVQLNGINGESKVISATPPPADPLNACPLYYILAPPHCSARDDDDDGRPEVVRLLYLSPPPQMVGVVERHPSQNASPIGPTTTLRCVLLSQLSSSTTIVEPACLAYLLLLLEESEATTYLPPPPSRRHNNVSLLLHIRADILIL